MDKHTRRLLFGVAVGAVALLLAWGAADGSDASARGNRTKAKSVALTGKVALFSCTPNFDKRPKETRLLQKDSLNSGAWIIPGIDPQMSPHVTVWSCKARFIEPSGQLRPFWRKRHSPPLGPAVKYDVCDRVTVTKMAKDRLWFGYTENHVFRMRIDQRSL